MSNAWTQEERLAWFSESSNWPSKSGFHVKKKVEGEGRQVHGHVVVDPNGRMQLFDYRFKGSQEVNAGSLVRDGWTAD